MKLGRGIAIVVALIALASAGWWFYRRGSGRLLVGSQAEMRISWRGKYQGTMTLPAVLNWCPITRVGVLEALSGDSGVVLVLYERDSLMSGPYLLVTPEAASQAARPAATFGMRWLRTRPDTVVTGFRAEAGSARVQLVAGKASGDVASRLRSVSTTDTVAVSASFKGVPVVTTAKGCA